MKGMISSSLLGAGCGGLGSMIGTIWNSEIGWIWGAFMGILIAGAIITIKYELLENKK